MRRHALTTVRPVHLLLMALWWAMTPAGRAAEPKVRPNVVLFLVDDMGWMDCGAYGSRYYETPNIDRFAARAMRFSDAYAQPLCSPTRASLLTGKYSARHGITSATGHLPPQPAGHRFLPESAPAAQPLLLAESKNYLDPSEYTLAEALRAAGYRTAHIGKWHLGLTRLYWPEQHGFDVAFHCHPDPGPPGAYFSPYGVTPDGNPTGKARVGTITDGPKGEYIVDRLAAEAVQFIEANRDRPFFLNLWNYGVHGPWGHKEEYTRKFAAKKDPRGVQDNPIMASMLKSVDECFGRVLDTLDRLGLTENTIIVFCSDNGGNVHSVVGNRPPTSNHPLRAGKGTLYEGGTRVPLMWAWAGRIRPGTTSDAVVGHIDLYPTLLELLELRRPSQQKMDGVSYAAVLRERGRVERQAFFNYFPHGQSPGRAGGVWVRAGVWKLIRWFGVAGAQRFELYNLRDDLGESKNLAEAQPARVQELDALIDGFLKDTGATYPRPNPAFKGAAALTSADPLEGWKARGCDAVVKGGVLTMTRSGKAGAAFLGHGLGKVAGPIVVKLRVRSAAGGSGKVEWLSSMDADTKSVPFELQAGGWTELTVAVPAQGRSGPLRLYLPVDRQPAELDWVEVSAASGARPQRWEFDAK
jgi:arylsulfatase A-like enzyme